MCKRGLTSSWKYPLITNLASNNDTIVVVVSVQDLCWLAIDQNQYSILTETKTQTQTYMWIYQNRDQTKTQTILMLRPKPRPKLSKFKGKMSKTTYFFLKNKANKENTLKKSISWANFFLISLSKTLSFQFLLISWAKFGGAC